jgi:aldose 1-epimerase
MTAREHEVENAAGSRTVDGFPALTLRSAGGLEATFVPGAGMVGCSLRDRGTELLGRRGGLPAYVAERKTFGIPLLYPWANRIATSRFRLAGRDVIIDPAATPVRLDAGLPIHGLLAAVAGWTVERHEATSDGARLDARFDFGADPALAAAFPFPHVLRIAATVADRTLTIATTVEASEASPVPIAFGYHPYLQLPDVPRADWTVELPVRERLVLDERMLPTGEREPANPVSGALGSRSFDDGYVAPADSAPFVLAGGGRRIEVAFGPEFRFAQVYAPLDDDVVAFEPMAAPANALVAGGPDLPIIAAGERWSAAFAITVVAG